MMLSLSNARGRPAGVSCHRGVLYLWMRLGKVIWDQMSSRFTQDILSQMCSYYRVRTQSGIVRKGIWTKLWKCLEMSGILTQINGL
jgi:hypothetical protein